MKPNIKVSALILAMAAGHAHAAESSSLHGFVTVGAMAHQEDKLRSPLTPKAGQIG